MNVSYQKITIDMTEFMYYVTDSNNKIPIKKAYLDSILNMFNGDTLFFRFSERPEAILSILDDIIKTTKNCLYRTAIHSDQDWGYQMKACVKKLKIIKYFKERPVRKTVSTILPYTKFYLSGQLNIANWPS